MPSLFPGMNPYLEQPGSWQDFHNTFLILLRETLTEQLRPRYVVRVEEHVHIHESPGEWTSGGTAGRVGRRPTEPLPGRRSNDGRTGCPGCRPDPEST
ncbi:DUF4058 family protein [bacterium]|nr:DUF4058 family protein [bacterium]